MAYWIQKTLNNHNNSNYRLYNCDFISDIDKLPRYGIEGEIQEDNPTASYPCAYGSQCICLEDGGSVWKLSKSTNKWCQMTTNSGINIATDEEVDEMLSEVFDDESEE